MNATEKDTWKADQIRKFENVAAQLAIDRLRTLREEVWTLTNKLPARFQCRELSDAIISLNESIKFIREEKGS